MKKKQLKRRIAEMQISDSSNIMGAHAQHFNFAHEFPSNGGFPALNVVLLEDNFPTTRTFSNRLKFGGRPRQ